MENPIYREARLGGPTSTWERQSYIGKQPSVLSRDIIGAIGRDNWAKHPVWRETRPGRWERPQSFLEKANILSRDVPGAIGRDNWAKHAVAKLEFSSAIQDPAACLQIAWKQVRYNHPEIAAFPYNGNYVYRTGDTASINLWVAATFSVFDKSVDELLGRIPRNEQMMCYFLPKTSEVMIWSPHYRVDARGAIYCLNHLCESLANMDPDLVFGGCAKNLSPSVEVTLGVRADSTPDIEKAVVERLSAAEAHHPALELTPNITSVTPKRTKRHFIRISKTDTAAINSRCSKDSLRLDAVLHASLITAVTKLAPPTAARSFMASYHSNLRALIPRYVVERYAPTSFTSVITSEVQVSPTTDFESYYNQLAPVHAKGYTPYLRSSALFHKRHCETKTKANSTDYADPRFAFLGVVDEQVIKNVSDGLIKVKDFWIGPETLTMQMMVHTWLWEDQLTLSICYNESYWDQELAAKLLDAMRETLMDIV